MLRIIGISRIPPPICIILDSWVFENFILADESFAKAWRILKTCVSVDDNLCWKLISLLESPYLKDLKLH